MCCDDNIAQSLLEWLLNAKNQFLHKELSGPFSQRLSQIMLISRIDFGSKLYTNKTWIFVIITLKAFRHTSPQLVNYSSKKHL